MVENILQKRKKRNQKLLSAIKLHDGTILYSKYFSRYINGWEGKNIKMVCKDGPPKYIKDESIKISDDAVDVIIHLLRGDKPKEIKNGDREKSRNGPPSSA